VLLIVTLTNTLNLSFFGFQKYLFTASVEVNLVILSTMISFDGSRILHEIAGFICNVC
jgi:hypothetical protein